MNITISFSEAVAYLEKNTYLQSDDASKLIKLLFHAEKFKHQIKRVPTQQELQRISEYVDKDKSLTYLNEQVHMDEVIKIKDSVNKTPPNLRK